MRYWIVSFILSLTNSVSFSQRDTIKEYKNSLYLEVAGAGGFGAINYEKRILKSGNFKIGLRAGLGLYHITDFEMAFNPDLLFPTTAFFYYGKQHHIEIGIGQTLSSTVYMDYDTNDKDRMHHLHTNLAIGYRYQKNTSRLLLKVSYTPIIEFNQTFRHWGSASIGYAF